VLPTVSAQHDGRALTVHVYEADRLRVRRPWLGWRASETTDANEAVDGEDEFFVAHVHLVAAA
jgi:hypothetical protein